MKKVVVIGGGFAGSLAAQELERDFEVTLIDTKDYFEFTPWIMRTIVNPDYVNGIQILHTKYLRRATVTVGEVKKVNEKFVKVNGKEILFDYLVICSGSRYEPPFKEQEIVMANRAEYLKNSYEDLKAAKRVVIVGGGLVGVELAGEILDVYKDKEVKIIHAGEKLIDRNSEKAIRYAEKRLVKNGAKILFNEKLKDVRNGFCVTDAGTRLKADLVFLCNGIKPNYEFMPRGWLNEKHQVKVNWFLQVEGFRNVFAAGDITSIAEEKTAQNAKRQARVVARNILALEYGRDLAEYVSKRTPMVISLGKWSGIYDNGKTVMTGLIPAFMKWAIKKKEVLEKG